LHSKVENLIFKETGFGRQLDDATRTIQTQIASFFTLLV